jgi:hypothetical protein
MARRFQLVLIKPSHYDDDGYVIQWLRSFIPSNTLAVLYSLASAAARRKVLGSEVEIDITAIDETNTRIDTRSIIKRLENNGGFGLVCLVGVQTNQYPRALDIARPLRAAGVPVMIGGFHVSGVLAMLPGVQPDLQAALDLGISLFAGEAEGRFDRVLVDAANGTMQPVYNFMDDLPALEGEPTPILPVGNLRRVFHHYGSFDAGRGCPYQCSFCTIINVQGRKSRRRSADDVERTVREHYAQGINRFFVTDDNFARNKEWEEIFDRLALLRERDKLDIGFTIQVDTLCHKIPNFIEKAARAGVGQVFIGLENINPDNLMAAKKRQNKITEYRKMLLAWKRTKIITYAGYILGFPADTPDSIRADIEIIKRELPIDILEFFMLTPLPGSEDHKVLWQKGIPMDPDMNKYDVEHVCTSHPRMSTPEWEEIYRAAWHSYYTSEHMVRILRRGAAMDVSISRMMTLVFAFSRFVHWENVHPLQGGFVRLKYRRDRRPALPLEPAWAFYPKFGWEFLSKTARMAWLWMKLDLVRRRLRKDPERRAYTDQALSPVVDEETETLELFTHNAGARDAVAHARKISALTHAA